jgi:tetratricopeptide (TPR) repeat protein
MIADIDELSEATLSIDGYPKSLKAPQKEHTNFSEIVNDLKKALSLKNRTAAYNYANILALNKQYTQSLYWYQQIIKQAPEWSCSYYNKALILLKLENKNAACENLSKAGERGEEKAYPIMKKICK